MLSRIAYHQVAEFAQLVKPYPKLKRHKKIWHGAILLRLDGAYDCVFRCFDRRGKAEGIQAGGFTEYSLAELCLLGRVNELCNDGYEHCTPNATTLWDDLMPQQPPTPTSTGATMGMPILSHRDGEVPAVWFW